MSKKNKLSTRKNLHAAIVQREKEEADKRKKKQEKKMEKTRVAPPAGSVPSAAGVSDRKMTPGIQGTKNMKHKGVRIRRNATIRGIRIKDAASKQKVKQLLAEEAEQREMALDVVQPANRVSSKGVKKKSKAKKAVNQVTKSAEERMAVD